MSAVQHAKAMVAALREDGELGPQLVEAAGRQEAGNAELKFDTVFFLALLALHEATLQLVFLFFGPLDERTLELVVVLLALDSCWSGGGRRWGGSRHYPIGGAFRSLLEGIGWVAHLDAAGCRSAGNRSGSLLDDVGQLVGEHALP